MVSENNAEQKMQKQESEEELCFFILSLRWNILMTGGKKKPSGPHVLFRLLQATSQTLDSFGNLQVFQSCLLIFFSSHPLYSSYASNSKVSMPKNHHKNCPKMSRSSTELSPAEFVIDILDLFKFTCVPLCIMSLIITS